uniref:Uncharacterized protein n=1 Tax=Dulem virus 194 TaxID=3145671 RepID=A0AAU8B210_9VIRU
MGKRSAVNPRKDQKVFTRTAAKVKSINLGVKNFRGGIRL